MNRQTETVHPTEGWTASVLFQSNFATSDSSSDIDDLAGDLALRGRRARVALRHRRDERRASLELDQLVGRPRAEYTPSTFLLSPDELRAEARRLYGQGWSVEDVCSVLDIRTSVR